MHHHLHLLALLVGTAVACQWAANRLQIPAIILLLAAGVVLGPVSGVLDPAHLFGDLLRPFVSLAVAVILFEGGLSLNLSEAKIAGRPLWRLLLSGLVVGFAVVTLAGVFLGGLDLGTAAVLGGILVVTGPTVIVPLLRTARISRRPATLLKWEGIVNDPLGALLAIFVFQLAARAGGDASVWGVVGQSAAGAAGGGALGLVAARLLDLALDRGWIAEHLKSPVMLGAVLGVFVLAEQVGEESGLLAVTAMGLVLANVKNPHVEDIRHFKEHLSTLLIGFLFVTLSASLDLDEMRRLLGRPLLLVAFILFLARPIVVLCASLGTDLPWRERGLLGWIAPRGVVAAAVAGAFEPRLRAAGYADAELLVPTVFGVIFATVLAQSFTIRPLARWLQLASPGGSGILVVGGARWVVELSLALRRAGAEVVMTESTYRRVSRARREGLDVHFGDVLSEEMEYELPLERLTWVFAAHDDDSYNALVCTRFAPILGRHQVLQLAPPERTAEHRLMGRSPWGAHVTYAELTRRYWAGATFKATALTREFTFEQLREQNPGALFLFFLHRGRLGVVSSDEPPPEEAKVVFITVPFVGEPAAASAR